MNCPKCKKELDHVNAYSQCCQRVTLDEDGHTLEWSSPEVFGDSDFECPECFENINDAIISQ